MIKGLINYLTLVSLLGGDLMLCFGFLKFATKPAVAITDRVSELEKWKQDVDARLRNGTTHFRAIDESNRVTQNALLAIMDALESSDNIANDKKAELSRKKQDLYEFLTDR
jgi:hypothetical protein